VQKEIDNVIEVFNANKLYYDKVIIRLYPNIENRSEKTVAAMQQLYFDPSTVRKSQITLIKDYTHSSLPITIAFVGELKIFKDCSLI